LATPSAASRWAIGSVPFNIACGSCRSCNEGWTSFCERTNPIEGMQGAAYGYADMGPPPTPVGSLDGAAQRTGLSASMVARVVLLLRFPQRG
jgi:hypothetical protein